MKQEIDNNAMWAAFRQELALQGELHVVAAIDNALNNLGFTIEENSMIIPIPLKQGESSVKWNENTDGNKPQVNHSVLMKTTHCIAEGEWQGEQWRQYRWSGLVRDTDVLSWMELSNLEKQGKQKHQYISRPKYIGEEELLGKQKPAGWSEEDEDMIDSIIGNIKYLYSIGSCDNATVDMKVNWLKSLRPQSHWKPSDEQMVFLKKCIEAYNEVTFPTEVRVLSSLYNDLKELKG